MSDEIKKPRELGNWLMRLLCSAKERDTSAIRHRLGKKGSSKNSVLIALQPYDHKC